MSEPQKLVSVVENIACRLAEAARLVDGDRVTLSRQEVSDAADLILVLCRAANGLPLQRAFGAPGDWGYDTPIGAALTTFRSPL